MKNEALEKLIDYLKGEIEKLKEYDTSFDSKSWGYEEGILITGNEALTILKACASQTVVDTSANEVLPDVNARTFTIGDKVQWRGMDLVVVEVGVGEVLIATSENVDDAEYNDWWVRNEYVR